MNNTIYKIPSFTVYRADGSKVPTIKKSFLVKEWIERAHLTRSWMTLEDGTDWNLVLEDEVKAALEIETEVFCIISYQVHEYGNFAIARVVKERKTRDLVYKDIKSWSFGRI